MNTNKLKSFAQTARRILMEGVSRRIIYYGFDAKGNVIDEPIPVPGGVIIREEIIDDATVPAKWEALRVAIKRHGVEAVVEEAAYTWFNRLMAMQILARNNYDPAQLDYESAGSVTPVILTRARRGMVSFLGKSEQHRVQSLLGDYQNEQKAFAILLTGYCHTHHLLNRIFGRLDDYTELLLPDNILAESGFIHLLNTTDAIADDDYRQVELIGWLYQFYISEKKDEVFANFKKNKKAEAEDIPAATQIFTPNWIVKYMVQNTIGRLWLDQHPTSPLRQKMKYLVESPDEPSSERSSFPPSGGTEGGLGIEGGLTFKLLDPACGSGHILVEGFFHLYDMYEEEYYMPAEAVEKILKHNLFGLDIDLRAAQLAQFAVLLAAATKHPDILKKEITPQIYAMPEPALFNRQEILDFLSHEGTQHEKVLAKALELMQQAKNLGSIMQFNVTGAERQFFMQRLETLKIEARSSLLAQSLLNKIQPLLQVFFILTDRYEAIAANPPYMGRKSMNDDLAEYLENNFPRSKSDLMTVFMEVIPSLTISKGLFSLINLPSWLFLSSFEDLRKDYLRNYHIESLLHMGRGIFGIDFGSVAFTIRKSTGKNFHGSYFKLHERNFQHIYFSDIEKLFLYSNGNPNYRYSFRLYRDDAGITEIPKDGTTYGLKLFYPHIPQFNFSKIPGSPIAFWVSEKEKDLYNSGKYFQNFCNPRKGIDTGENAHFLRLWYEVKFSRSSIDSYDKTKKWFPYNKGGDFRKWYGNREYIVNWENVGEEIKSRLTYKSKKPTIRNSQFHFLEGFSWGTVSSNGFSCRYIPPGCMFDNGGCTLFAEHNLFYFGAQLNTKIASRYFEFLSPTLNFQPGDVGRMLYYEPNSSISSINKLTSCLIDISKIDWDSRENSWDFKSAPIVISQLTLEASFQKWEKKTSLELYQLQACEEELNRIYIDIYDLNIELDPIVLIKDITILQDELDQKALEETDEELRKRRQWKLEEGKWNLYIDNQLQAPPAEGELPKALVQPPLPIKKNVVMQQFISYAIGCMMGRYSLDASGLILANQGETLDDYFEKVRSRKSEVGSDNESSSASGVSPLRGEGRGALLSFLPDDDGIIPLMGSNCGFADDAALRLRQFIEAVWGSNTLTQNINFLQACLDMEIEKYLVSQNNFWKDHCSRYKKKPIYWLFSSKKGAFQVLVYMHRMNRFTVQKIRDNYMLKHLQWLGNQVALLESRSASLTRDENRRLDDLRSALHECREYDLQLKDYADQQIEFDLDDGVSVNYAKFGNLLATIK